MVCALVASRMRKIADRAIGIGESVQKPQKSLPIDSKIGRGVERRIDIEVDPKRRAIGAVVNRRCQIFDRAQRQIVATLPRWPAKRKP